MSDRVYRRYCLVFLASFLLGAAPFGVSYLYLRNVGEYMPPEEAAHRQQQTRGLLGSAVFDHGPLYKLELLKAREPEVVAFGSSRVLQFRERFFSGPFVNMGRAFNLPREGLLVAERMADSGSPKVVILGVDFWWFNPRYRAAANRALTHLADEQYFSVQQLILPFRWIWEGKLSMQRFLGTAFGRISDPENIGVMAQTLRQGFGPDGSFYYTGVITGEAPRDVRFSDTKNRIRTGEHIFAFGDKPDAERVEEFMATLDRLRGSGAKVVVFASPFAPTIYRALKESGKHGLMDSFVSELQARGVDIVDFQDSATTLGSTDAEFIDGFHGGDLTYAKVLQQLGKRFPDTLGSTINWPLLDAAIADYRDIAFLPDAEITMKPEVDFLRLGVSKPSPGAKEPSVGQGAALSR